MGKRESQRALEIGAQTLGGWRIERASQCTICFFLVVLFIFTQCTICARTVSISGWCSPADRSFLRSAQVRAYDGRA